ncbi:hypothetical protein ACIPX0_50805 [Streptomyces sp. NPDC090075]|uniref:hypothetical protein n=1 Tax=Streptomyces sp. NPDC090075 TaxID=3365937 RepID=UPI0037FB78C7
MTVHYQRGQGGKLWPKYECNRVKADYGGELCQQLSGSCMDRYVNGLLGGVRRWCRCRCRRRRPRPADARPPRDLAGSLACLLGGGQGLLARQTHGEHGEP